MSPLYSNRKRIMRAAGWAWVGIGLLGVGGARLCVAAPEAGGAFSGPSVATNLLETTPGAAYFLAPADVKDPQRLALRLREGRDPLALYLRDRCSSRTRQMVFADDPQAVADEALAAALAQDLNRLMRGESLYTKERFAGVKLSQDTRTTLDQNPKDTQRIRLNRLLLEDAYPEALVRLNDMPLDVRADSLEIDAEKNLLIASGHVIVRKDDEAVRCDHAVIDRATYDVLADGRVTFERGSDVWTGPALRYNFKTRKGNFGAFTAFMEPFYIRAESSQRVSDTEYELRHAVLTTCEGDAPRAYLTAHTVWIVPGKHVRAKHVVLYVRGVPVMYSPYWNQNIGDKNFISVVPGYNRRMSAFLLTAFNYRLNKKVEAATHVDYRVRRGLGLGQDVLWSSSGNAKGLSTERYTQESDDLWHFGKTEQSQKVKEDEDAWFGDAIAYVAQDRWPDEGKTQTYTLEQERYRTRLYHSQALDEHHYALSQFNYLSDPEIIHQYFRDEYKTSPEPENYFLLGRREDNYTLNLLVQKRLNDFFTGVNRFPELSLDMTRQQIADSPFYYEGKTAVGYYEKEWESALTNAQDYAAFRFDTDHTVYYPTRHFDFLNVIPRAGYRGTYYSATKRDRTNVTTTVTVATNGVVSNSVATNLWMEAFGGAYRSVYELGVETSFKTFKVWETYPGDVINNVRHIAEPYANYKFVPEPNVASNTLYQFDETDGLGLRNEVRLGLRNKLQTKRLKIYDLLKTDLWTTYRLRNEEEGTNAFAHVSFDVESLPFDWLTIDIDGEYDAYESEFALFNTRFTVRDRPAWDYAMEHRYSVNSNNLLSNELTFRPVLHWQYGAFARYEFETSEMEAWGLSVRRAMDCLATQVGYEQQDDDYTVYLQFWFTQFPKVKMDVGL